METRIKDVFIKCGHCGHRFESRNKIGDVRGFETAITMGNKVACPNCREMIDCNKENMSYVLEGSVGGMVGGAFGDKPS